MLILGQKGQIWTKRVQNGRGYNSPDCKPKFFQRNYKIGFYTKNQQSSTSRLEDIN